jgi:hypothetical protein
VAGAIGALHVVTTVGGQSVDDRTLLFTELPHEVRVTPAGSIDAPIDVRIDGYLPGTPPSGTPILERTAESHFVPGKDALLRVQLQGQCLLGLPGGPPGGPTCDAPLTCISGACASDAVPAQGLEPYVPDWASNAPDICKPANAGAPVLQVGTGQTDYLPLTDGQTVQMEQGPQGGHHIWIAVRQENLKQSGSTTTITSVVPSTGQAGPMTSYVFTFDPDQGGFCKLYGLRYQLDADGTDYHKFLGQPLDLTVVIEDASGAKGTGSAHINIDPQLLCPSGTAGCS